ncbi:hypothetical protein X777_13636 [Ooceraea biroi]|uniref:Uncharacterized protein n=1 Tax=Ooceraea biroi TaxID=2015173 RepID=A0A026WY96_OOCBI|nr:hypothetical protein X777_13636 [Ooceraea biroi]
MAAEPIFADLQGFIVQGWLRVKEVAVLRTRDRVLTHHVFRPPVAWSRLTRDERSQAAWLTANYHRLRWTDGNVPYGHAGALIRRAVSAMEEGGGGDDRLVYVKGAEKRWWLEGLLGDLAGKRRVTVRSVDDDFEDIAHLSELVGPDRGTYRCSAHSGVCALENVLKLHAWWMGGPSRARNLE